MRTLCLALLLSLIPLPLLAQPGGEDALPANQIDTSQRFGDYEVFYSVFPSTFLMADIAASYKIKRAKNNAVVNISVLRHSGDGKTTPVAATLKGHVSDLVHRDALKFQEVREQDARYYLAQFRHLGTDTANVEVQVLPEGADKPFTLTFARKVYAEE